MKLLGCDCGSKNKPEMRGKEAHWVECSVCGKLGPTAHTIEGAKFFWALIVGVALVKRTSSLCRQNAKRADVKCCQERCPLDHLIDRMIVGR